MGPGSSRSRLLRRPLRSAGTTEDGILYSPEQLLDDLVGALELILELLRVDVVVRHAGLAWHDARELRRRLDVRMSREVLGLGHDLLAFLAQDEVGEQHGGMRMLGVLEHRERAGSARHRV